MFYLVDVKIDGSWRSVGITRQFNLHEALSKAPIYVGCTQFRDLEIRVKPLGLADAEDLNPQFVSLQLDCPKCGLPLKFTVFYGGQFYVCDICEAMWPAKSLSKA